MSGTRTFYVYFVSYASANGFGNLEISLLRPINSIADTKAITEIISAHATEPVILYYQLLRKDEK